MRCGFGATVSIDQCLAPTASSSDDHGTPGAIFTRVVDWIARRRQACGARIKSTDARREGAQLGHAQSFLRLPVLARQQINMLTFVDLLTAPFASTNHFVDAC